MRRMCPKEFEINRKAVYCYKEKCPWKLFRVKDYKQLCMASFEKDMIFKNKDNPAVVLRNILIKSGIYKSKNFDRKQTDKALKQLYLYCEEKVEK